MALAETSPKGRRKSSPFTRFLIKAGKTVMAISVTMLGLLFMTFVIGRVMPVDPVLSIVGERASQEMYDAEFIKLGLDKPIVVQFFYYIRDVVTGNFGISLRTGFPVWNDIVRVFPATMELATIGTILGVLIGVPLGVLAAVKRGTWIDQIARVVALIGYSMPVFWIGLIGLLVLYGMLGWIGGPGRLDVFNEDIIPPVTGMILIDSALARDWFIFKDALSHIILPASLLGYYSLAYISRMTRSFMLEQLSSEYITTARVKGMSERAVIWKHAFGNIKVQLITVIALSYAGLLEGSVLTEIIFSWPGIGSYITTSLLSADMNAVMGGTVVVGLVFVLLNVFAELLYKFFDPRAK